MLGLYGSNEFKFITNDTYGDHPIYRVKELYTKRPGFFTPYQKPSHFFGELLAPIYYPLVNTGLFLYSVVVAVGAALVFLARLFLVIAAGLFGSKEKSDEELTNAASALSYVGKCLINATLALVFGVFSIPHSLISLVTRSGATLVAQFTELNSDYDPEAYENELSAYEYEEFKLVM